MTLTIEQIKNLAEFVGLCVQGEITDDEKETEITIADCPEKGIDEDGSIIHCRLIAYFEEYPEEGVCPLDSLTPNEILKSVNQQPTKET